MLKIAQNTMTGFVVDDLSGCIGCWRYIHVLVWLMSVVVHLVVSTSWCGWIGSGCVGGCTYTLVGLW